MPRLPRQSQQNSLVYMGMVSRGNPPDNEPNQSLAAPSNKKLRLDIKNFTRPVSAAARGIFLLLQMVCRF
jgi:hypothetical protein